MKKRMIALLLTVVMVAALFSGMGITAYAADTIQYTLKSGDTVYNVCQSLGIDFYANYTWITTTNNIKDYSHLKVGTVLTLPAPGTTPTPTVTGSAPVTGTVSDGSLLSGDFVTGYFVPHVMASGETVYGVCNALGIDFNAYSDLIKAVNNIKSYNHVAVGKVVLLPTTTAPSSGSCIKIVAHRVLSGDTAIDICKSYGVDYKTNLNVLKILNNKEDLNVIKANQLFYLPVTSVVSGGSSSGGSSSGSSSSGGSSSGTTPGSGTSTNSTVKTYSIYTYKANGSLQLQVNGSTVSKSKAGDTISVTATPDAGYKLDSISVYKYGDSSTAVEVTDGSFKMPEYDVVVNVKFVALPIYSILNMPSGNGAFELQVDGKSVSSAYVGATVTVKTAAEAGHHVDRIEVWIGSQKEVLSGDTFTMPDKDVVVIVVFKADE